MNKIGFAEEKFSKKYHNYFGRLKEIFRKGKGDGIDWNDLCYMPMAASMANITLRAAEPIMTEGIIKDACLMSSFAGWRANQKKIIEIDELKARKVGNTLYKDLVLNTNEIFEKVGFGTFIEYDFKDYENFISEHIGENPCGVLLHIEHDINKDRLELRANVLIDNGNSFRNFVLHILDEHTITECIMDTLKFTKEQVDKIKSSDVVDYKMASEFKELDTKTKLAYHTNEMFFTLIIHLLFA